MKLRLEGFITNFLIFINFNQNLATTIKSQQSLKIFLSNRDRISVISRYTFKRQQVINSTTFLNRFISCSWIKRKTIHASVARNYTVTMTSQLEFKKKVSANFLFKSHQKPIFFFNSCKCTKMPLRSRLKVSSTFHSEKHSQARSLGTKVRRQEAFGRSQVLWHFWNPVSKGHVIQSQFSRLVSSDSSHQQSWKSLRTSTYFTSMHTNGTEFFCLKHAVNTIKNHYCLLHELLTKNMNQIKGPWADNTMCM